MFTHSYLPADASVSFRERSAHLRNVSPRPGSSLTVQAAIASAFAVLAMIPGAARAQDRVVVRERVVAAPAPDPCFFRSTMYGEGSKSCQGGQQFRCGAGAWVALGLECSGEVFRTFQPYSPPPPAVVQVSTGGESCRYEAITVSTGSTVCQMGTTYLCSDGQWVNLGSMCR